jgi:hypothetical protein
MISMISMEGFHPMRLGFGGELECIVDAIVKHVVACSLDVWYDNQ